MKNNYYNSIFRIFLLFALTTVQAQQDHSVKSPDGKIQVRLNLGDQGNLFYNIHFEDDIFLEDSPLGMKTSIGDFSKNLNFIAGRTNHISESYRLNRAKVSNVQYEANELVSSFTNENNDTLKVIFRLSDRDVAFSYEVVPGNDQTKLRIYSEATGFDLPDYATTYITPQALPMTGWQNTKPSYEEEYTLNATMAEPSKNGVGYTFPALFKLADKGWVLISETGVHGQYVGSRLGEGNDEGMYHLEFPQEGENNGIGETFPSMALPAHTPWRTVTLGENLTPVIESTVAFDLVKPLYEPSRNYKGGRATWSWIVWQDNSINYEDQLKYIDLASELGFEYVLIDNWWDHNIGHDRMEELVKYANSKNVDVLLWYNSNGYWNNAPQTPQDKMNTSIARKKEMHWMQKIGVKGIKVDFFGGDKQVTMQLYEDILSDANDYGLGVVFHGCTLPRGWQRMFPNYMSSEAVLASENLVFTQHAMDIHARTATILPFTRNSVGAMDYAPVFLNKRLSKDQKDGTLRTTTDAFELATAVLYFSPIQHFGLTPNNLEEQPNHILTFLRNIPAAWDETLYISGEPEKEVVVARRKDKEWYVAAVNGEKKSKNIEVSLPMLAGENVKMIYDARDGTAGIKELKVNDEGIVSLELLPEGGAVIIKSEE